VKQALAFFHARKYEALPSAVLFSCIYPDRQAVLLMSGWQAKC